MEDPMANRADSPTTFSGRARPPGVISVLEIYRLDEAKARLGWSDSALRAAKRRGLQILVCGKRRYISGKAIAHFLEKQAGELPA